jgi:hypothetical protein
MRNVIMVDTKMERATGFEPVAHNQIDDYSPEKKDNKTKR